LDEKEGLQAQLRSAVARVIAAQVELVLPDEIACAQPERRLVIAAGQARTLTFPLENLTALPGSTFPVFIIVSYTAGEERHAVIAQGSVAIVAPQPLLTRRPLCWWTGIGALTLLFLLVQIRRPNPQLAPPKLPP
jgi:hypothetical protein